LTIQSSIRLNPAWLLNGMARAQLVSMTPDELKARTRKFAVDIIQFARIIPRDPINDEIVSQLTDAATSDSCTLSSCLPRQVARGLHQQAQWRNRGGRRVRALAGDID